MNSVWVFPQFYIDRTFQNNLSKNFNKIFTSVINCDIRIRSKKTKKEQLVSLSYLHLIYFQFCNTNLNSKGIVIDIQNK